MLETSSPATSADATTALGTSAPSQAGRAMWMVGSAPVPSNSGRGRFDGFLLNQPAPPLTKPRSPAALEPESDFSAATNGPALDSEARLTPLRLLAPFQSNYSSGELNVVANFYNPAFLGMHPPSSTTMQDEQQAFAFHNQAAQGPMNALQAAIDAATAQAAQSSIDAPQATIDAALPPPPGPPPVAPTTSIPISNQLDYGAADEDDDDSMHDGHHHSRQPAPQQPAVGGALMAAIAASRTHTQYETSSPQNYYVPLSPSLNDTPLPPAVLPEDYEGFELGPSAGADDDDDVVEVPQPTSQPSTSNTKADANANANANAKTNKGLPAKPTPAASTTPANAPWRADERARNFIKAKPVKPDIVEQYYTR
ncbi:unnamed protein product, partial [Tilletia controversa]